MLAKGENMNPYDLDSIIAYSRNLTGSDLIVDKQRLSEIKKQGFDPDHYLRFWRLGWPHGDIIYALAKGEQMKRDMSKAFEAFSEIE